MKLWIRTLEAGLVGVLICGLASSQTLALNGTITFGSGCTTPERTLLTEAMRIMVGQVIGNPKPTQACLKDAILSGSVVSPVEGDVTSPEIITARLAQDEPTTIECLELGTPGTNDGAQASVGSEFVEVDHGCPCSVRSIQQVCCFTRLATTKAMSILADWGTSTSLQ